MPSNEKFLPTGMSTLRFRATPDKADVIQNLVVSEDGTLKAMTGPTLYEPREVFNKTPANLGRVHAIWHGYLNGGQKEALIIHAGNKLYCHWGAIKTWKQLVAATESGLPKASGAPRPLSNDSETVSGFIPFNNGVIFYDGKGPPLFINNQLYCDFLGFSSVPSAPVVRGPENANQTETETHGEGSYGYSWHGGLGTPGDRLNGEDSHILKGSWSYKCQYESYQGDLSALSDVSADVQYGPKKASPAIRRLQAFAGSSWEGYGTEVGVLASPGALVRDLSRGAAVIVPEAVPANTKFVRVLRTKDLERNETDYYVAWKVPSPGSVLHDWVYDKGLTILALDVYPIPSFSAACMFNGSLVILDKSDVRQSEPGFPGTFLRKNRLTITADGRQGTAVFSIGRSLFAATDTSIVDCTDFARPITVSRTIGVAGPNCWCFVPGAGIVFISRQGVYRLSPSGSGTEIDKLSVDIENMWRTNINVGKLRTSVVWYSRKHNELRVAVAKKGQTANTLILAYSNGGWRKYDLGLEINCFAYADDLELVGGTDNRSMTGQYTADDVYVLEKETSVYTPPVRKVIYESDYEPIDESLGAARGKVVDLYLCFVETHAAEVGTVKLFTNYETDPDETFVLRLDDVYGNDPERKAAWGQALLGTDKLHERRVVWRKVRAAIRDVQRFKFRIETTYPNGPELVAAMYKFNILSQAGAHEPDFQET